MAHIPISRKIIGYFFFLTKNRRGQKLLLGAGVFFLIYLFLFFSVVPLGISAELGIPSPKTIYASREVVDYYSTNKLREEAAMAVSEAFDYDPEVFDGGRNCLNHFFQQIREIRDMQDLDDEEKVVLFREKVDNKNLPQESIAALLALGEERLEELQSGVGMIFREITFQGIKENGEQAALRQVFQDVSLLSFQAEIRQGVEMLIYPLLRPNMIYNEKATEANREFARQSIEPVRILKNSLIVQEGEKITEKHLAQLEALGFLGPRVNTSGYIGLFLLLAALYVIIILYLYFFNEEIWDNITHLALLSLIVVLTLIFGLAGRYFSIYLMPIAMGSILITILFNWRLAIFMNIILSLLLGFIVDGEFSLTVITLLGGLIAVYSVSRLQRRSDLAKAGLYVAVVNMALIVATFLLFKGFQLQYEYLREFSVSMLAGIGSGFFSAVMAIGLLPFLESAFGMTTAITLLELTDPGHPLLRRLLTDTPGTYHHSIMVGNLAEAAAEAIHADPLLSRVAAFYHDIGKIRRPFFFVENQFTGKNPHDKISPNLSALIIRSHVKDGLELAREAKLPLPVREIIQQHHGTTLISFFYQQAVGKTGKDEKAVPLPEEEFRYEGPLPQTKEAAILLLADSVEAAVRSLSNPAAGRIENMIRRIIKEKLNDGQIDEAPLTLKDLDKIGDTFLHILSGFYHQRLEYPEKELRADLEGGKP
ncbi:MAG TPA: HDIG domain-containing protein [Firmicutes bacterium]|jgi:putative nucleotidyltransferase with HDIG domain|nr:HDIG domain-containing protein [Bacillota bacterium]